METNTSMSNAPERVPAKKVVPRAVHRVENALLASIAVRGSFAWRGDPRSPLVFRKSKSFDEMKLRIYCLSIFAFCLSCSSWAQKAELVPYVDFLKKQKMNPVDYVMDLFDRYDIVILGERDHRDTTQYELITKIISDKRFIEKVGNVFTEIGVNNRETWANEVLKGKYDTYADFETELRKLYREMFFYPYWEKYSYWLLLTSIYKVNASLPEKKKIDYYPLDVSFDWRLYTTPLQYSTFMDTLDDHRDRDIGRCFITAYNQILEKKGKSRKKALVIFNTYHSFQNYRLETNSEWLDPAAAFIFKKYPGRVANIMINNRLTFKKGSDILCSEGKWDAAFKWTGNQAVGFDFANSPFGCDVFDRYDKPLKALTYKDIYTGFIFYRPIEQWVLAIGIPGIIDQEFLPEFERRLTVCQWPIGEQETMDVVAEQVMRSLNHFVTHTSYEGDSPQKDSINKYINYWIN